MPEEESRLLRIYCADDDDDIRTITQLALTLDPRIEVTCVASGGELLDLVAREGAPDLLLLDSLMPQPSGVEVARRIRTMPAMAQVPIIFLTAEADPRHHGKFYDSGATAVICKPFDPLTLVQQIERAVTKRQHDGG